jgi:hypothetical protein
MGRFVSATGQFLLATYEQFSRPHTGSSRCPLTLWSGTPQPWEHSQLIYLLPVVVIGDDSLGIINDRRIRYPPELGLEVLGP